MTPKNKKSLELTVKELLKLIREEFADEPEVVERIERLHNNGSLHKEVERAEERFEELCSLVERARTILARRAMSSEARRGGPKAIYRDAAHVMAALLKQADYPTGFQERLDAAIENRKKLLENLDIARKSARSKMGQASTDGAYSEVHQSFADIILSAT